MPILKICLLCLEEKKDTDLHLGLQVYFYINMYKDAAFLVVSILVT